jgi:hypothetical protein
VFGIDLAPEVPAAAPPPPPRKVKTVNTSAGGASGPKTKKASSRAAKNKVDPDARPTAKRRGKTRK